MFSDSSSSGLFADYDSAPSDDNEFVDYSPREEFEDTTNRNDDCFALLFDQDQNDYQDSEPLLAARNDDLE